MPLETTLEDIGSKLREGRFPNEQSISQGIVLRILGDLDWDVYDTNTVWPEYSTGEGRVDFALCDPPSKPKVFVEVKQSNYIEDGVRQALEYAFHTGVPFIVLTDGKTWSFYLPAEQGSYEERRVFKLDLFERSAHEAARVLQHYLERSRISSGLALEDARDEYKDQNRRAVAREEIPDAWKDLIDGGDELLIELIATTVESKVGVRPTDNDVIEFLHLLDKQDSSQGPPWSDGRTAITKPQSTKKTGRRGKLSVSGKNFGYDNAMEATIIVLRELGKTDPTFLERLSHHPACQGRKRRYVARSSTDLYPDRPDLREYCARLPGNWLVSTNLNNQIKKTIVQAATDVTGLKFGKDVIVDF